METYIIKMPTKKSNVEDLKLRLKNSSRVEKVDMLNEIAYEVRKESPKECIDYARQALNLSKELNVSGKEFTALNNIGLGYRYLNEYDKALEHHFKSLEIAEELNNKKDISVTLNNIGLAYEKLSDFEKAFGYHQRSLKLREETGDEKGMATSLSNIGILFENKGENDKALEYYYKSLKINEEFGDKDGISITMNNIGNAYLNLENFEKAKEFHFSSLREAEDVGDEYQITVSLINIGLLYEKMKEYTKAIEYYDKSLVMAKKLGSPNLISVNLFNIGVIYEIMGDYEKALEYCKRSLEGEEKIGSKYEIAFSKNTIGNIYRGLGNYEKALSYIDDSLSLAKEGKMDEIVKNNYLAYSDIFFDKGDYNKALDYYKKYTELKDSVFNEESRNKIAEMQVRYETEKKEKENELLKQKNEIQKLQIEKKENLEELNATKDKFFSIIAHDLKSPFLSMMTFVNYLKDMENYDKAYMDELLEGMENTVKTSINLLENLLEWAKTQTGKIEFEPVDFSLKNAIDQTVDLFKNSASQKNIKLNAEIDSEIQVYADKNMINTVLRNLISNAIKFSYSGGVVDISSEGKGELVEIVVRDKGVGISSDYIDTIFNIGREYKTKGTADEKGTGLGLILCREFVLKNGGEISVNSEEDKGSTFKFTLPLSKEK